MTGVSVLGGRAVNDFTDGDSLCRFAEDCKASCLVLVGVYDLLSNETVRGLRRVRVLRETSIVSTSMIARYVARVRV